MDADGAGAGAGAGAGFLQRINRLLYFRSSGELAQPQKKWKSRGVIPRKGIAVPRTRH